MAPVCGVRKASSATERMRLATAPALAASMAPWDRKRTVSPYSVKGTLKTTIRPRISAARCANSAKLVTTLTGAVMPPGGVPTLPPKPSIGRRSRRGDSISTDSVPRSQRGTTTGSPWTFSNPSRRIRSRIQSTADSRAGDALGRAPKVSHSSAKRSQPSREAPMADTRRSIAARVSGGRAV